MATKKTSSTASKPTSRPTTSRPAPAKRIPVQAAPRIKTTANGQPRPKKRGK